jgi:predicted O-methyltransferase YrrM
MYSRIRLAKKFIKYYLTAANAKGHGVHSPFVFNFIRLVLNDKNLYNEYRKVELLRHSLSHNHFELKVDDMGAGSLVSSFERRTISQIVNTAAKPRKYAQLLYRMTHYYHPDVMLELGTSLGISSAYMALGNPAGKLITLEGAKQVSNIATDIFKQLNLTNIEALVGNFDNLLPEVLSRLQSVDLVFIDGNHRKEPTLNYFNLLLGKVKNASVIIIDDIHWSDEMEEAWEIIKNNPAVHLTIDLFFMGIVFFKDEFKIKQHFTIRY